MPGFSIGGDHVELTLCDNCLQPFIDDPRYVVRRLRDCPVEDRLKDDCQCFICGRRGHDYDVQKPGRIHHGQDR